MTTTQSTPTRAAGVCPGDYAAVLRHLGGTDECPPIPDVDLCPVWKSHNIVRSSTDRWNRKCAATYYAVKPHTLHPRALVIPPARVAVDVTCGRCLGERRITEAMHNGAPASVPCTACHSTGIANHPDPDDPLSGMSDSVADWATQQACWMVLGVWEADPQDGVPANEPRRLLDGEITYNDVDQGHIPAGWVSSPDPIINAYVAVWNWAPWENGMPGTTNPENGLNAMKSAIRAGLDLTHWYRHCRARLACREGFSTELETETDR